jgi:hypothetical protein
MHALGQQRAATASAAAAARAPARVVLECTAWTRRSSSSSPASSSRPLRARAGAQPQQQKGFGGPAPDAAGSSAASSDSSEPSTPAAAPARRTTAATRDDDAALEALEARLKSRRQAAKLEAKVKVESAAVRLGTGQAPGGAGGAGETLFVQFLGALFVLILVEGLVLAASVRLLFFGGGGEGPCRRQWGFLFSLSLSPTPTHLSPKPREQNATTKTTQTTTTTGLFARGGRRRRDRVAVPVLLAADPGVLGPVVAVRPVQDGQAARAEADLGFANGA